MKPEWKAEKLLIGYSSQPALIWKVNKRLSYVIREHVPVMTAGAPRPFILGIVIYDGNVPLVDAILNKFVTQNDAMSYAERFNQELFNGAK